MILECGVSIAAGVVIGAVLHRLCVQHRLDISRFAQRAVCGFEATIQLQKYAIDNLNEERARLSSKIEEMERKPLEQEGMPDLPNYDNPACVHIFDADK